MRHAHAPSHRGPQAERRRRMTVVNGMLVFVILIVTLQLWLLTASMNHYLAGGEAILVPAALVSAACLLLNLGLLWYLYRMER